jgi:hypothetical protein
MRRAGLAGLAAFALVSVPVLSTATSSAASSATSSAGSEPVPRTHVDPLAAVPVKRACPDPTVRGQVTCLALVRTDVTPQHGIQPQRAPAGLGAVDLRNAYKLPTSSGGRGATVAIINVFDDPKAESDLAVYRSQYGLPPCTTANGCFKKVNASGGATLPRADTGWAEEMSLDLDMVSAACPNCRILLVEADQASISALGVGVDTAVRMGAKYISNSYGGSEEAVTDAADFRHFDHPGVAITAASGDGGYGVLFPATASHVTAVGGTSLLRAATARGWNELAWSGAGSGCSSKAAKPPWQKDTGCPRRTIADVSAVADPRTGVAVYDTYGFGGWQVVGGTSASAPIIAGAYALAGSLPSRGYAAALPYANARDLNDVVQGSTGTCSPAYLCTAGPGYDGPTGLGTPNGVDAFKATRPTDLARAHAPRPAARADAGAPAKAPASAPAARQAVRVPARAPSAPAGIVNGGFEQGNLSGWTASGVTAVTKDHPHGGKYAALIGDPDDPHKGDSSIRQTFTAAGNQRRLSFWYAVTCRDREGTRYDWATASLRDNTTGTTRTVLPKTCTTDDSWRQARTTVFGGHTYTLTLVSHDDGYFGDPLAAKYDDVEVF